MPNCPAAIARFSHHRDLQQALTLDVNTYKFP